MELADTISGTRRTAEPLRVSIARNVPNSSIDAIYIQQSSKRNLFATTSQRLQAHAIFRLALEGHAEFEQLDQDVAELGEEGLVVGGVAFDVFLEFLVFDKGYVGREHHEGFAGEVLVLFRAVPLRFKSLLSILSAASLSFFFSHPS